MGALQLLKELDFPGTGLEGTIPASLSSLVNLRWADWRNTSLTGGVPDGLCLLEASGQLDISLDCDEVQCCQ
jgi:hypothetical protein